MLTAFGIRKNLAAKFQIWFRKIEEKKLFWTNLWIIIVCTVFYYLFYLFDVGGPEQNQIGYNLLFILNIN